MSCNPCLDPPPVNIPGPPGTDGIGIDGLDGRDAFTTVAIATSMPAELGNVVVAVFDSAWAAIGQNVVMQFVGEFEVLAKPSLTSLTLKNLKNSPSQAYMGNLPPGTPIQPGYQISPSGKQGSPGAIPGGVAPNTATYITQIPSGMPGQAMSTLATGLVKNQGGTGIQSIAVDGTDYLSSATGLKPAAIGTTIQAKNANLDALSGLAGAADRLAYFTGAGSMAMVTLSAFIRTLLDDANATAARNTLGARYGLLGSGVGLNLKGTAPDPIAPVDLPAIAINSTKYIVDRVLITDASISLTVATLGLFGGVGTGLPVICADQSLSVLTGPTKQLALTISGGGQTDVITNFTLIPRLGTAQGASATASIWIFGFDLS